MGDDALWFEGDDPNEYSLLVPFTCLQSAGGDLDDHAFVIGFILGGLNQAMTEGREIEMTATIQTVAVGQLDLIAMARGYTMKAITYDPPAEEWSAVILTKAARSEIPTTKGRGPDG